MSGSPFPHEPDWHALRLKNIGGSEIAALFGMQPAYADSLWSLWQIKAGNAPAREVDNERVRWGLRLEAPIAQGVAEDNGWTIEKGGYVTDPTTPGMGCTLDYVVLDPARPDPGALEIKNVDMIQHRRVWTDGEPPLHIILQLQHQLACTGYCWGVVAGLVGGNTPHLYRYERHERHIASIRRKVRDFWQSIADGREPPIDGSDAATAVVRAMYPELDRETVDLSAVNEGTEACADFLHAAEAKKAAEGAYAEARNRVERLMDGHAGVQFTGFWARAAVTPAKPDRVAKPGEVIKGRAETRRLIVSERVNA